VTVVRLDGCRVVVLRVAGCEAEVSDVSRPKVGKSNFGSFGLGNENELVSRAVGWLLSEILVPVARGTRAGSVELAGVVLLNGFVMVGNLNPSAFAGTLNAAESRQASTKVVRESFTIVLLLASDVELDGCCFGFDLRRCSDELLIPDARVRHRPRAARHRSAVQIAPSIAAERRDTFGNTALKMIEVECALVVGQGLFKVARFFSNVAQGCPGTMIGLVEPNGVV